jgi:tripartite-type tricarboxylate transporter receptor subunit TctC
MALLNPTGRARRAGLASAIASAWAAGVPAPLRAQVTFPRRSVTIVVPFAAGGIADLTARAVGEHMSRQLGQPVVIENRPSAGSIVASQAVARARADGHTLLLMSNGNAVSVGLFRRLPYDPVRDFAPIGLLGRFDLGVFVAADSPHGSLAELIAFARARPGELKVGTVTPGSTQHLAAQLFLTRAGLRGLSVPYRGTPAVLTALRAGEVDVAFEILGPMLGQVQAGAIRVLAVSAGQRMPALPQVPTVQESGVADYDVSSWNALAAPAGTPAAAIRRLNETARAALADPGVQARLTALGVRPMASSPDELAALLAAEIRRWGEVIRQAGIQPS